MIKNMFMTKITQLPPLDKNIVCLFRLQTLMAWFICLTVYPYGLFNREI